MPSYRRHTSFSSFSITKMRCALTYPIARIGRFRTVNAQVWIKCCRLILWPYEVLDVVFSTLCAKRLAIFAILDP